MADVEDALELYRPRTWVQIWASVAFHRLSLWPRSQMSEGGFVADVQSVMGEPISAADFDRGAFWFTDFIGDIGRRYPIDPERREATEAQRLAAFLQALRAEMRPTTLSEERIF